MICTLDNPVYLTRIKGKTAHCLDRSARPRTITFDPTEYRFKLALLRNNHEEMLHIIRTSTLIGQSIIAYLQQKGFPEVNANVFVWDCCLTPVAMVIDRIALRPGQEYKVRPCYRMWKSRCGVGERKSYRPTRLLGAFGAASAQTRKPQSS